MYKKVFLVAIIMIVSQQGYGQETLPVSKTIDMYAGYEMGLPVSGGNLSKIGSTHGFNMGFAVKPKKLPIWIGGHLGIGFYYFDSKPQTYKFTDGSVTETTVDISSTVLNYQLLFGYDFLRNNSSKLEPYANLMLGGAKFSSYYYINNPNDPDGCEPLEQDVIHSSKTFAITPGLGVRYFPCNSRNFYANLNVGYSLGGELDFMLPTDGHDSNHNHVPQNGEQPFYVDFRNRVTQVVHRHAVGYIYTDVYRMLNIRLTVGFRL